MAPVRIGQKKITAYKLHPVIPSFKRFDDVEDINELPRIWSVVVRVEVKFPVEPRFCDKQHFILVDTNGSKVEAISYGNDVQRFNNLLHQGSNYTIHGVMFGPNWGELERRNIAHRIELTLTRNTTVEPYTMPLQFPRCPRHLMPFIEVRQQPNKTFVDIMGVIVSVQQVDRVGRRISREIVLLDSRWNLIVVEVSGDLLRKNALQWERAKSKNTIMVGTMMRCDPKHRCLESSDHTTLDFNPRHEEKHGFEKVRKMLKKRKNLRFINRFQEYRWAYLARI